MDHINDKLCIDEDNMIMSGASNGGMFTYHMMSQRPNKFKGFFDMYGQPQLGYLNTPLALKNTNFLSLHGRQDVTIPYKGGYDDLDQFGYESVDSMVEELATVQECD